MIYSKDPTEFYVELGNRIRESRLKAQMGQEELAEKLDLTRASIVNIEKGRQRPLIHTILNIAELLNTTLYSLIPGSPQPELLVQGKDFSSWADFEDIISDEFKIDESTQNTVKQFYNHLKK